MASSRIKILLTFCVGDKVCIRYFTLIIIATSSKLLLILWFRICVSAIQVHIDPIHLPLLELLFTLLSPPEVWATSSEAGDFL